MYPIFVKNTAFHLFANYISVEKNYNQRMIMVHTIKGIKTECQQGLVHSLVHRLSAETLFFSSATVRKF